MLGSSMLETAIGLIFVYLIFSLIASAIAEYFSASLNRRGEHLKHILFNLFDNDDPQGRTFLNLFVSHPMVQALSSTDWKPTFLSADQRFGEGREKFERTKGLWDLAAKAVADSNVAKVAAKTADDAAAKATAAAAGVEKASKASAPSKEDTDEALRAAISDAETTVDAAQTAADAADQTAKAAKAAAQGVARARKFLPQADAPGPGPTSASDSAADGADRSPAPVAVDSETGPAGATPRVGENLEARAKAVVERAGKAVARAKQAANGACKAAKDAEKSKNWLYGDLIGLVNVPKYIPDRTFADVVVNVLTSEETLQALSRDEGGDAEGGMTTDSVATRFWDRFAAAIGVVRGVTSRLPDSEAKGNVDRCLVAIDQSLKLVGHGAAQAAAVIGQLEKGTNELRGAVAAVSDDTLRAALEREIEASLRPMHAIGQDVLMLQRAGQAVALMAESSIKTALTAFLEQAGEDLGSFKRSVGSWYNDVMDHASGWYKRNTQRMLVVIAIVLCALNNVDTVSLVLHLSTDPKLLAATDKEARAFINTPGSPQGASIAAPEAMQAPAKLPVSGSQLALRYKTALESTSLPLWWTRSEWEALLFAPDDAKKADEPPGESIGSGSLAEPTRGKARAETKQAITSARDDGTSAARRDEEGEGKKAAAKILNTGNPPSRESHFSPKFAPILAKLMGILLSSLAVSMGAPFWFDLLNKLVNVRLVGKRPEPSFNDAPQDGVPTSRPVGTRT